jgi:hypothetical protein
LRGPVHEPTDRVCSKDPAFGALFLGLGHCLSRMIVGKVASEDLILGLQPVDKVASLGAS